MFVDTAINKQKLECVTSYHMFGNIISVCALKLPWNSRDVLLLSFKDAKVYYIMIAYLIFV